MRYYCNNIEWWFEFLPNGWIGVFEVDHGLKIPKVQAKTIECAKGWCNMHERLTVQANELCPDKDDKEY